MKQQTPILGFLGFGEAGYSLASGFHNEEGIESIYVYDAMQDDPKLGKKLAEKREYLGAVRMENEGAVAAKADIIFMALPSNCAVDCVTNAAKGIRPDSIFVDVSTATAADKRTESEIILAKGAHFVDGAMLGALPLKKHRVAMTITGEGCRQMMDLMAPYHMNLDYQGEEPGKATSIKFVRSVFTKGMQALAIETVRTAQHFGVEELVIDSIKDTLSADIDYNLARWLGSPIQHAKRRSHEMANAIDAMKADHLPTTMAEAVKAKLDWLDAQNYMEYFPDGIPEDWREIIKRWPVD